MDEKLVEVVARAYAEAVFSSLRYKPLDREAWIKTMLPEIRRGMRAAIAAINASGTHWVAPWEITATMQQAGDTISSDDEYTMRYFQYKAMRDAYLAEQEKTAEQLHRERFGEEYTKRYGLDFPPLAEQEKR